MAKDEYAITNDIKIKVLDMRLHIILSQISECQNPKGPSPEGIQAFPFAVPRSIGRRISAPRNVLLRPESSDSIP